MTIVDKDMGWAAFGQNLHALSGNAFVSVGVQGSEAGASHDANSGLTNVQLAAIHEYGLGVPERSFIRATIDIHQRDLVTLIAKLGQRAMLPPGVDGHLTEAAALSLVGEYTVGIIKERIIAHIPPPLSEERKKEKGSDTPLIEFGTLLSSITYKLGSET